MKPQNKQSRRHLTFQIQPYDMLKQRVVLFSSTCDEQLLRKCENVLFEQIDCEIDTQG